MGASAPAPVGGPAGPRAPRWPRPPDRPGRTPAALPRTQDGHAMPSTLRSRPTADPYADTDVVDARAPRFLQATVGAGAVLALATGWWWLYGLLALQLVAGLVLGRCWCLPCVAYFELVQPRVGEGRVEDARPPRFANKVGATVLSLAFAAHLAGLGAAGTARGGRRPRPGRGRRRPRPAGGGPVHPPAVQRLPRAVRTPGRWPPAVPHRRRVAAARPGPPLPRGRRPGRLPGRRRRDRARAPGLRRPLRRSWSAGASSGSRRRRCRPRRPRPGRPRGASRRPGRGTGSSGSRRPARSARPGPPAGPGRWRRPAPAPAPGRRPPRRSGTAARRGAGPWRGCRPPSASPRAARSPWRRCT